MRSIFIISVFALLSSCKMDSNWIKFSATGIPDQDETYKEINFINEQVGFVGGRHLTLLDPSIDRVNFQNTAVLYKTLNQGKTWQQIPLPFLGSVEKIIPFGDTIILKLRNDNNDTTSIIQTNNNGKTWKTILIFTNSSRVIEMEFNNSQEGKLLITNGSYENLISYNDNKVDTILKFGGKDSPLAILNDNVISLKNVPSTANFNGYVAINQVTGKEKEIYFDSNYYVSSYSKYKDELFLAASKSGKGYILKLNENGFEKITFGKFSNYEPDELFVYNKTIIAIGNRQDEVGPIGIIRFFFISTNGGKSWDKEEMPSPMCIEAPVMYRDKFFMSAGCPPGFFQIRK